LRLDVARVGLEGLDHDALDAVGVRGVCGHLGLGLELGLGLGLGLGFA
jgi:hypothetical protein